MIASCKHGTLFHWFTDIHLWSAYEVWSMKYVTGLIFLGICNFLLLLLLFLIMAICLSWASNCSPLYRTSLSAAREDRNKLFVKSSAQVTPPLVPVWSCALALMMDLLSCAFFFLIPAVPDSYLQISLLHFSNAQGTFYIFQDFCDVQSLLASHSLPAD